MWCCIIYTLFQIGWGIYFWKYTNDYFGSRFEKLKKIPEKVL